MQSVGLLVVMKAAMLADSWERWDLMLAVQMVARTAVQMAAKMAYQMAAQTVACSA